MSRGWLAPLLLAAAACGEPTSQAVTPTDRFAYPSAVALTARPGGGRALVVASGNYDLAYRGSDGGTVLSVDPTPAQPDGSGGSAGRAGGALVKLGEGAHVGSFTGELVVADAETCPVPGAASQAPEALVTTRYADQVWRLPMGADASIGPCAGDCVVPVPHGVYDPFGLALACRPDGLRRSAFVGFMRPSTLGGIVEQGWIAEVDLDSATSYTRIMPLGGSALGGMAYDAATDRLFVLGQPVLGAPVYVLDLGPCPSGVAACAAPRFTSVDLWSLLPGLDLQSIALSNPQAGLGRRAYVSARVYDPNLAQIIGYRPGADLAAVLLVLDVEEGVTGRPALRLLSHVDLPAGLGPSQVKVLPVRAPAAGVPRRDVVVVSGAGEGVVLVYDDDDGAARYLPIDGTTGAPEVGRAPYGLAAERLAGATPDDDVARVYVAASRAATVGIVDVPLARPAQAHVLRTTSGAPVRIGGIK